MSLSYEGKNPIARVVDLDTDKSQFIYISPVKKCSVEKKYPMPTEEEKKDIAEAVSNGADLDTLLDEMYPECNEEIYEEGNAMMSFPENKMVNVIPSSKSERIMVAGRAGLGKSVWAAMYATEYHDMFPDNHVYVFSRSSEDPAFDDLDFDILGKVVDGNSEPVNNTMEEFEDSLVIFDDMDNLPDKKVRDSVHRLMADIMANGRKLNIYCLYLTHVIFNREQTKSAINEANKFVFFTGGNVVHNRKYLKENVGLNKETIDDILNTPSRWVCLNLLPPKYAVMEHEILLL